MNVTVMKKLFEDRNNIKKQMILNLTTSDGKLDLTGKKNIATELSKIILLNKDLVITSLNLKGNSLQDVIIKDIITSLYFNPHLTTLNLCGNGLTDACMKEITNLLWLN